VSDSTAATGPAQGIRWGTSAARWVLLATVTGAGLTLVDATAVNVALPALGRDLDAGVAGLQWTLNGYTLTLAALILLGGSLADRFGRRRIYLIGVVWFAVASALCGLAPSLEVLVASRALQGVGGALLTPGSLAILQASFAPSERARAIGAWSGLSGIAAAVGPLVGGWLITTLSWRWIFLVNLPLATVVVAVAARHVPETRDPTSARGFDIAGASLAAGGLVGVTWALIEAGEHGASTPVVAAGVAGLAALAAFVRTERRSRHPMLPLGIFSSRQFTSANLVTLVVYGGMSGMFFLLAVFLQQALGYSPLAAGAAIIPVTLLMLTLSERAGQLAERIGPRLPMSAGPLVMASALALMTRFGAGMRYVTAVLPAVVVFGLGLSLTVAPLTATVLAAADERHSGIASGVNNAVARSAGLLAVAVLPALAGLTGDAYLDPAALTAGFHTAMAYSAGLVALGGLLAAATIRNGVDACPATRMARQRHCAIDGPPIEPAHDSTGTVR
jgi:EmrB/QacA subfamily drug resistance transporter